MSGENAYAKFDDNDCIKKTETKNSRLNIKIQMLFVNLSRVESLTHFF
jgi:hypothetical protein